jgi:rubrerythrin
MANRSAILAGILEDWITNGDDFVMDETGQLWEGEDEPAGSFEYYPEVRDEAGKMTRFKVTIQELSRDEAAWFTNYYTCPACGKDWTDEWSATCDDDCPHCGERHISPHRSEEATKNG